MVMEIGYQRSFIGISGMVVEHLSLDRTWREYRQRRRERIHRQRRKQRRRLRQFFFLLNILVLL